MIETDLSKRCRSVAEDIRYGIVEVDIYAVQRLLLSAAQEIDRYYNGMMNWKRTAEAKDAEYVKSRVDKEAGLK